MHISHAGDRGEENREQAAALPEEVDNDSAESALLKDYPPLPVVQSTGELVNAKFLLPNWCVSSKQTKQTILILLAIVPYSTNTVRNLFLSHCTLNFNDLQVYLKKSYLLILGVP